MTKHSKTPEQKLTARHKKKQEAEFANEFSGKMHKEKPAPGHKAHKNKNK